MEKIINLPEEWYNRDDQMEERKNMKQDQKNIWKIMGMRIRRERMKRNWSQSGLCYGICAVSYLSKIEQGKMEVSEEILKLLL